MTISESREHNARYQKYHQSLINEYHKIANKHTMTRKITKNVNSHINRKLEKRWMTIKRAIHATKQYSDYHLDPNTKKQTKIIFNKHTSVRYFDKELPPKVYSNSLFQIPVKE